MLRPISKPRSGDTVMAHTYTRLLVHIVFATKDRAATITPTLKPKLEGYMVGILKNLDVYLHRLNSVEDHTHMLVDLPATMALAEFVQKLKSNSSGHLNDEGHKFAWQRGYGGFSISQNHVDMVVEYIRNQEEHHRKVTLGQELKRLMEKYGFIGDPEFVGE
jgi:REP element-mobilizing transposase RayT